MLHIYIYTKTVGGLVLRTASFIFFVQINMQQNNNLCSGKFYGY